MIKFLGHSKTGARIFGFGLSKANLSRLEEADPILVDLAELTLPGYWAFIFYAAKQEEGKQIAEQHAELLEGKYLLALWINKPTLAKLRKYESFSLKVGSVTGQQHDEVLIFGGKNEQQMKKAFSRLL